MKTEREREREREREKERRGRNITPKPTTKQQTPANQTNKIIVNFVE